MKKYMIGAAALMLFTGIINAQATQKQPAKAQAAKPAAYSKPGAATSKSANSTASVSPAPNKTTPTNTEIKRKHHHKKTKTAPTTEKK